MVAGNGGMTKNERRGKEEKREEERAEMILLVSGSVYSIFTNE